VAITWWKEPFRWCSTTPVVVLNSAHQQSEQWRSPAPQVEPTEDNIQLTAPALLPEKTRPHLMITGSHGDDPLTPLVIELGLQNWVTLCGWLTPEALDTLYAESTLLVFPTFFEGFGLPVLEAMARGCPVVCSDIPVLHEVAGDAAVYVDSRDAIRLAESIGGLLSWPEELARLAASGLARAAEFT